MNNNAHDFKTQSLIKSEQTKQLYFAGNASIACSVLLASILSYVLHGIVSSTIIFSWLAIIVLLSSLRAWLIAAFFNAYAQGATDKLSWLYKYRSLVFAAGATWGAAGLFSLPPEHSEYLLFIVFMIAGLSAGGIASYSSDLVTSVSFSMLVISPTMIRLLSAENTISVTMGIAMLIYVVFMLSSLKRIYRNAYENIVLHRNAAKNQETIRSSEQKYRQLLEHSPIGIFHYDLQLNITFCNERFASYMQNSIEVIVGSNINNLKDQSATPTLIKTLSGEVGNFEGLYKATLSDANIWVSVSCAPMLNGSSEVIGGVAIVQDISDRKRSENKIQQLAFYDQLTQLPNRQLLLDRLKQAMASSANSGKFGALLFLDIDQFKLLNDSFGHDAGDALLRLVASRLTAHLNEDDTVGRLGGDEFLILLENLNTHHIVSATQVELIGEEILSVLNQPYPLGTHDYMSSVSIGIALFRGHSNSVEDLLKQADIAMYQSKKAGRNTLRFFDPQMQKAVNIRLDMERELRKAIENSQFQLHYQIQVNSTNQILGAEALIRWLHPDRGLIPPNDFIPLAEETGLILPIGEWVLETACAQLKLWQQNTKTRDLSIAVNVSAKQFYREDFSVKLKSTIQRHQIDPTCLKLELTESSLLDSIEGTIELMEMLNKMGIQFSLDDFGTSYSSLQYLKKLPLSQLKIDQSFVRDIVKDNSDQAIVGAIIAMAKNLELDVIAEGVESEAQRKLLLDKGCSVFQGYLFGKPVPSASLNEVLDKYAPYIPNSAGKQKTK